MSGDGDVRLSVSEEKVKNLLYEMKDRLLEDLDGKFEKKADLFMLNEVRRDVDSLKQWRSYVAGAAGLAVALAGIAVVLVGAHI